MRTSRETRQFVRGRIHGRKEVTIDTDALVLFLDDIDELESQLSTANQRIALLEGAIKKDSVLHINDGCGECSAIWQNSYELTGLLKALKASRALSSANQVEEGE